MKIDSYGPDSKTGEKIISFPVQCVLYKPEKLEDGEIGVMTQAWPGHMGLDAVHLAGTLDLLRGFAKQLTDKSKYQEAEEISDVIGLLGGMLGMIAKKIYEDENNFKIECYGHYKKTMDKEKLKFEFSY